MIIGRENEIIKIKKSFESEKSEFVSIYGRRRVGKTFLLKECFNYNFDFTYTGIYKITKKLQINQFLYELRKKSNVQYNETDSWFILLEYLKIYLLSLNKDKVVVFIDELPWIDTKNSMFLKAFEHFWNNWEYDNPGHVLLKLYVCGSATTWMLDNVINSKGGLYGRTTDFVYLTPFTLKETKEYFNIVKNANYSNQEVLSYYMVFGGIPYYLEKVDKFLPYSVNINNIFFTEKSSLKNEFNLLYESLFTDSDNYLYVIETISKKMKGLTRNEISTKTSIQGSTLTKILYNLENCNFIRKYNNCENKTKESIYQLTDLFTLFYLRFVKNNKNNVNFFEQNYGSSMINAWFGYAYEMVVLYHIKQITDTLYISGISHSIYSWQSNGFTKNGCDYKGGQIDLIIDRSDNVMNIVEVKYSDNEFILTKDYFEKVKARMAVFKEFTNTKKALKLTFITNKGMFSNEYSRLIDALIVTDDLFK